MGHIRLILSSFIYGENRLLPSYLLWYMFLGSFLSHFLFARYGFQNIHAHKSPLSTPFGSTRYHVLLILNARICWVGLFSVRQFSLPCLLINARICVLMMTVWNECAFL